MAIKRRIETKETVIEYNITLDDVLKSTSKRELENKLNYVIEQTILPTIDKGLSPVAGERMFAKYKNPKQYPGDRKQSNKPNLTLTGEMLSWYEAKSSPNEPNTATMGIHKDAPDKVKMLADVHNNGTRSDIAMRPFIPKEKKGERFTAKIERGIRAAFSYVLSRALADALNKGRSQK